MDNKLDAQGGSYAFPSLLSQTLVAFTIAFDNEFEHRMPHRTTKYGSTGNLPRAPWLVSMAMWLLCMQYIPEDGITMDELTRLSRLTGKSMQTILKRMGKWWGYLVIEPASGDSQPTSSKVMQIVRPTRAGHQAQTIWEPLIEEIEDRWCKRYGSERIERLRTLLISVVSQFDSMLPDYIPVGEPRLEPKGSTDEGDISSDTKLVTLLSKILLALALDFDRVSDLSLGIYTSERTSRLAISANILRVLDEKGLKVQDIPRLTGVAKMTTDNWLKSLQEHHYLVIEPDPLGSRFKVARLTTKGRTAQDTYFSWVDSVEQRWESRFGKRDVNALQILLAQLVGEHGAESPLFLSIKPNPDGWRTKVSKLQVLPFYPVVSPRGGFPDGS